MNGKIKISIAMIVLSLSTSGCMNGPPIFGGLGVGVTNVGVLADSEIDNSVSEAPVSNSSAGTFLGTQIIKKDGKSIKMCKYRLNNGKVITKSCH